MSADALKAVIGDTSPVPAGVQAILLAIAWRTPSGTDRSVATRYRDIAEITRQHRNTVSRNVIEAISIGALEVAWANDGDPRGLIYRVNRGAFYVPSDPDEISTALTKLVGVAETDPHHDGGTSHTTTVHYPHHDGAPLKERRKEEEGTQLELPTWLADLDSRLQEKGHYHRD